nr:MAG TPA: hypothetical protein [Caudoviricetes sp.]
MICTLLFSRATPPGAYSKIVERCERLVYLQCNVYRLSNW